MWESFEIIVCHECANYYVNDDMSAFESLEDLPTPYDHIVVDIDSEDYNGTLFRCDGCGYDNINGLPATVESRA